MYLSFAIFYAFLARRSTAWSSAVGMNNGLLFVKPTGKIYRLHNICSKGHFRDSTVSNLYWVAWERAISADTCPKYYYKRQAKADEEVTKDVLIEVASNKRTQRTFEKSERKPMVQLEIYPEYTKVLWKGKLCRISWVGRRNLRRPPVSRID